MRIKNIVSCLDCLLLLLLDIGLGKLDELLTLCVHPSIVLVTIFVAKSTIDM
jgi:hypothetical protein